MIPSLPAGMTAQQVLSCWVDRDYNPTFSLRKWANECGIVLPDKTFDGFVDTAQAKFQRYHDSECKIPKARTEINLYTEDEPYDSVETDRCLQALNDLGLFYNQFALPTRPMDYLLWHAAYLPELLLQFATAVRLWGNGIRWKKLFFLGAANSVGEDLSLEQLLEMCTHPSPQQSQSLQDVYNPGSYYWNAPRAGLIEEIWKRLRMPDAMRKVPTEWLAAPDGVTPDGKRKLANTQDTFAELAKHHTFNPRHHYGLLTRAPTALRQWLITRMFLEGQMPGAPAANSLSLLCAPYAKPLSRFVVNREAANVGWEKRKALALGIQIVA